MLAGNAGVCTALLPPGPRFFLLSDLSKGVTFLPGDWGFLRIRAACPPSATFSCPWDQEMAVQAAVRNEHSLPLFSLSSGYRSRRTAAATPSEAFGSCSGKPSPLASPQRGPPGPPRALSGRPCGVQRPPLYPTTTTTSFPRGVPGASLEEERH